MKINNNTKIIILIIIILIAISSFIIIKYASFGEYKPDFMLEEEYIEPKKTVGVNEYEVVSISEETTIKTYFSIFINSLFENPQGTYNTLNEEYRNKKYPTLDSFNEYIKTITEDYTIYPEISTYKTDYKNDKTIYYVYDKNKNEYIFSVEAVMVYTVYLDEETMEIE